MSNNTNIIDNTENLVNSENIDNINNTYVEYYNMDKTVKIGINTLCLQSNPPQHKYYIIKYNTNNEIIKKYKTGTSSSIIGIFRDFIILNKKMTNEQKDFLDHLFLDNLFSCNGNEDFYDCEIYFTNEYRENKTFKQFIYNLYNSIKRYFRKLFRKY